jgi:hypothetical protein
MTLSIDSEFQALISLLTAEERAQLEANTLAEGCRDTFAVWAGEPPDRVCTTCPPGTLFARAGSDVEVEAGAVVWRCQGCGHVEHHPWIILDGHTRYSIVTTHKLAFEIAEDKGVQTREEAVNWIINHQLGRRNLTPDQASYLRGKRYNLEKHQGERTDLTSGHNVQKLATTRPQESEKLVADQSTTAKRLGAEYHVDEKTIRRDGQYADAVDTIADTLGPEVRQAVLAGDTKLPKRQVMKSAKTLRRLKGRLQAEDFSFMWVLDTWRQEDALALMARLPADEHAVINALLDQPGFPARDALDLILRRLPTQPPDARQRFYELHASADPRDRARALREATGDTSILLPPLRYLKYARAGLQQAVRSLDQCVLLAPTAPWSMRLQALLTQIQALQGAELVQVVAEVEAYFEGGPEADAPTDEIVDEAEDRDGAVDQDIPELDVEHESTVASNLTTALEPVLDSESQASVASEDAVLPCGCCGSTQTWRAEASGRIYCDDCHAVYNPAAGCWHPGERAKHHATSALGASPG